MESEKKEDILQAAMGERVEAKPVKKRKRGRPKKVQAPTPEEIAQKKAQAEAQAKQESINHWGNVGAMAFKVASQIVNDKWPGCGPTEEEIERVKPSIGWILDDVFPEGDERGIHYTNLLMGLVTPTVLKIIQQEKKKKIQEAQHMNGLHPKEEKTGE